MYKYTLELEQMNWAQIFPNSTAFDSSLISIDAIFVYILVKKCIKILKIPKVSKYP
jgi:hypothetical protein